MLQPLKNKTVLVTRSTNQTEDFSNKLSDLGATIIKLPLIQNTAINQTELQVIFLSKKFNWIIFTSTNAVEFFFKSIAPENIKSKIAVVGKKTRETLEKNNLKADFIPTKFTAKQLAKELPVSKNDSILIPRSNLSKNDIVDILEERECNVKTLSIYENNSIEHSKKKLVNIFNKNIDFITFTSGSTILSFLKLGIELNKEKIICIGPETAKIGEEKNLNISAIANPHTTEGMVDAIISLK